MRKSHIIIIIIVRLAVNKFEFTTLRMKKTWIKITKFSVQTKQCIICVHALLHIGQSFNKILRTYMLDRRWQHRGNYHDSWNRINKRCASVHFTRYLLFVVLFSSRGQALIFHSKYDSLFLFRFFLSSTQSTVILSNLFVRSKVQFFFCITPIVLHKWCLTSTLA